MFSGKLRELALPSMGTGCIPRMRTANSRLPHSISFPPSSTGKAHNPGGGRSVSPRWRGCLCSGHSTSLMHRAQPARTLSIWKTERLLCESPGGSGAHRGIGVTAARMRRTIKPHTARSDAFTSTAQPLRRLIGAQHHRAASLTGRPALGIGITLSDDRPACSCQSRCSRPARRCWSHGRLCARGCARRTEGACSSRCCADLPSYR